CLCIATYLVLTIFCFFSEFRPPLFSPLFPYTTLFRSCVCWRCGILRISLTAAILCLFPTYFSHFEQNSYSRHATEKFAHLHTTQRSAPRCARVAVESAADLFRCRSA